MHADALQCLSARKPDIGHAPDAPDMTTCPTQETQGRFWRHPLCQRLLHLAISQVISL